MTVSLVCEETEFIPTRLAHLAASRRHPPITLEHAKPRFLVPYLQVATCATVLSDVNSECLAADSRMTCHFASSRALHPMGHDIP